jgi:glutamyl-tRNA synthetase
LKPDGNGKLSKRDGDRLGFPVFPLEWKDPETGNISSGYREKGYLPKAFLNMLLLLGWAPSNNQEIFTLEEMIETFSLERIGKSGSKFDPEKTKWFNQQYLRNMPRRTLAEMILPTAKERGYDVCVEYMEGVVELMLERAVFPLDLLEGTYLFEDPKSYDEEAVSKKWKKEESGQILSDWSLKLQSLETFNVESIDTAMKSFLAEKNLGMGQVMPLFRIALTGVLTGPGAAQVAALLGKEFVIPRIQKCIETLG